MTRTDCVVLVAVLGLVGTLPVRAASPDTLIALREMASFQRATSISIDPAGSIVVADAGRNAVFRLTPDGEVAEVIGGPGSEAARFDGPMGVDATNGLILLVADAGNGRVQRFARDGRFLEWLPVWSDPERRVDGPEYLERDMRPSSTADGRPTDVVSTDDGRLFVIESVSGTVRTWDRERRPGAAVGIAVGDAIPVRPVAMATDGERVYVADAGLPGVVVLDRFGRPGRSFGSGVADGIRAVAVGGGCIWIALPGRIVGFSTGGILIADLHTEAGTGIVDLALHGDLLYVLARNALYVGTARCELEP